MYHYTECDLQNVWLANGYTIRKTPYGRGVSIHDVEGLHRAIGSALARKPRLTGAEFRFLRKELGMSQSALAAMIGTSEQNVSLWERRGKISRPADRLVRPLYLEHIGKNPKILDLISRLNALDEEKTGKLQFAEKAGNWHEKAAA